MSKFRYGSVINKTKATKGQADNNMTSPASRLEVLLNKENNLTPKTESTPGPL